MPKGQSMDKCVSTMRKKKSGKRSMRRSEAISACNKISRMEKKDKKKYKVGSKTKVKVGKRTYK